jgi:hypothetical protein
MTYVAEQSQQLRTWREARPPVQTAGAGALAAPDVSVAAAKGATPRDQIDEA